MTPNKPNQVKEVKVCYVKGAGYFVRIDGFTSCCGVQQHTARNELIHPGGLTRRPANARLKAALANPRPAGYSPHLHCKDGTTILWP